MTSSELNYLIKLDLLRKDNEIVRMTMLAKEAGVSKPSMLQALEKFEKMNILKKDDKNTDCWQNGILESKFLKYHFLLM